MKRAILLLLLTASLLLSACSKQEEPKPSATPEPTPTATPTPTPEPTPEIFYHPLTGEQIDAEFGNSRPFAVMINNISVALPHCGVSNADILYEVLAEGDITRMMPIFSNLNDVGAIGSIRSSRPYYIEIAMAFDAIYVHAGGSEQAYSDISSRGVDNIDGVRGAYANKIFYRDPNRQQYGIEHSLFTTSEKLLDSLSTLGYETEHSGSYDYGLDFTDTPDMNGSSPASNVHVSFGGIKNTYLSYNAEKDAYNLTQYKKEYIDANTGEALYFDNILVLYADTKVLDDAGRREVTLNTTGDGLFICSGNSVPMTWSHLDSPGVFSYYKSDGQPLELSRGKTYIAIVPTGSTITME